MSIKSFFKSLMTKSLRQGRSGSPRKVGPSDRSNFRPGLETLEAREVPARLALLDFDGASLGEVRYALQSIPGYPDPAESIDASSFVGAFATLQAQPGGYNKFRWLDLNNDGVLNRTDGDLAVNLILARVREDYLGNDLIIAREDNSNLAVSQLNNGINGDVLLFIGGQPGGLGGIAPVDVGNTRDGVGSAGSSLGVAKYVTDIGLTGTTALTGFVNLLSNYISHEAGHTFGLGHVNPLQTVAQGVELMTEFVYTENLRFGDVNRLLAPDFWPGTANNIGFTQNPRRELFAVLGARDPISLRSGVLEIFGDTNVNSVNDAIRVNLDPLNPTVTVNGVVRPIAQSAVTSIFIYGGDGNDIITLEHTNGKPVTVFGMEGNDTVQLSPSAKNLRNVNSNVTIWGGGGFNSVTAFDDNSTAATTYSVTDTTVLIAGRPAFSVSARESAALTLSAGSASNATVNVYGTSVSTRVSRAAIVNVGSSSIGMQGIRGHLTVDNPPRYTALTLDDRASNVARTGVTVDDTGVFDLSPAFISYPGKDLSSLTILGSDRGNTFTIGNTAQNRLGTSQTRLDSGRGNDTVNVYRTTGQLIVNGQLGSDTVTIGLNGRVQGVTGAVSITNAGSYSAVTVDDSADTVPRTVLLYKDATNHVVSGLGSASIILRSLDLSALSVRAGSGGNTFRIHDTPLSNTPGGLTTTVGTGAGSDTVTVNGTSGALALNTQGGPDIVTVGSDSTGLDRIQGAIRISGPAGSTHVTISDTTSAANRALTHTITATQYSRTGAAPVYLSQVQSFLLRAGQARDTINVRGNPTSQSVISFFDLSGGAGNDTFNVGSDGNQLAGIGTVTTNGQEGFNTLIVNDQGSGAGQPYTVAAYGLYRTGVATVGFVNVQQLVLNATGGDGGSSTRVSVQATLPTTSLTVNVPGNNQVVISNPGLTLNEIQGPVRINGGGNVPLDVTDLHDTVGHLYTLTASAGIGTVVRTGGTPIAPIRYSGVSALQMTGGTGDDTFRFEGISTFTAAYGGGGNNSFLVSPQARNLDNVNNILRLDGTGPGATGGSATLTVNDQVNPFGATWELTDSTVQRTRPAVPERFVTQIYYAGFNSVTINGGAGDDAFAIQSTSTDTSIGLDGGGGTNTLDYSGYSNIVPDSGLVSRYHGEGTALDGTGGNHGTLVNGVSYLSSRRN